MSLRFTDSGRNSTLVKWLRPVYNIGTNITEARKMSRAVPLVLTATLLAACSHHPRPATAPAPQQQASAPVTQSAPSSPAPAPVKFDDSGIRSTLTQMTFFAYDRSELSD